MAVKRQLSMVLDLRLSYLHHGLQIDVDQP